MNNLKRHCLVAVLLSIGFAPMSSLAAVVNIVPGGGTTATLNVTLSQIIAPATLSTTPINFGAVLSTATNMTATGTITVNVTNTIPYTISIDGGLHAQQAFGWCRNLKESAPKTGARKYSLYTDANFTTEWGDSDLANSCAATSGGAGTSLAVTGTGVDQVHTVYAKAGTGSTVGTMADTLTITVTY